MFFRFGAHHFVSSRRIQLHSHDCNRRRVLDFVEYEPLRIALRGMDKCQQSHDFPLFMDCQESAFREAFPVKVGCNLRTAAGAVVSPAILQFFRCRLAPAVRESGSARKCRQSQKKKNQE